MKTNNKTWRKNLLFSSLLFSSLLFNCYAQQSTVVIKINDFASFPNSTMGQSGLTTGNNSLNSYLTSVNATMLSPLYPSLHVPSSTYPSYLNAAKNWYIIKVDNTIKQQVVNDINQNAQQYGIEFAINNLKPENLHTPNDYNWPNYTLATPPSSGQAWDGNMVQLDDIKAKQAWDYTTGNPNVRIAIVDDGFDINHEELLGTKVKHIDFQNPVFNEHGTAVATLAAGNSNNNKGISAIGYDCSLMLYSHSPDPIIPDIDEYGKILQAVADGANIINCSFGVNHDNPTSSKLELWAIEQNILKYAYEQNVFVVAAAGNGKQSHPNANPTDYQYPASYDYVFSVTSCFQDAISPVYFQQTSNPNFTHQINNKVDIAAPGFKIWHATAGVNPVTNTHNYYGWGDGTSFASPIVAGTAGLLLSINPCLTPEQITNILKASADDISTVHTNSTYSGQYGAGRLNAFKAMQMVSNIEFALTINSGQNIGLVGVNAVQGSIKIKSGGKLRIEYSTISMLPMSKIVVEPGAELIIQNSTLKAKPFNSAYLCPPAPSRWQGIIAEGNKIAKQQRAFQAFVVIKNSTLQDAKVAITTRKDSEIPSIYLLGSGAIINCNNTIFKDNGKCVEFWSYQSKNALGAEFDNISGFNNCTFIADRGVLPGVVNNYDMVTIWDVRGVGFNGCLFKNQHQTTAATAQKGNGILAVDASYHVRAGQYTSASFENLEVGIKDYGNYAALDKITVQGVQFAGNKYGIILNDGGAHNINNNTFSFNNHKMPQSSFLYGIQTNSSSTFHIEMNTFIGTNPTNGNTPNAYNLTAAFNPYNSDKFGANSSTMNSVFQHNTITSGAVGEYVNDNTTSASIRCNTHNQDNITKEGLYVQVDALKTPFFGACPASQTRVDYHNRFITATNSPANHLYKLAGPSKDYLVKKDEAFRPLNAFSYGYNVEDDCNEGSIQLIYCDYKNLPNNGGIVIGLPADKAKYAAIKVQLPNPPTGLPDFGHPTLGGLYSDLAEVKHDILFGYMNSFGQEDDAGIIDEYLTFLHHDGSKEFKRMHIAALYDLDSLEQMQHMLDEYEITDSDDEAFFSYFSMLLIVQSENRSIFDLTESEHNMLIEMATTEYAVAESAKGILELVYHQNFTREVEYIPTENNNGYSANNNQSPHVLELSPNPVMQNGMLNVSYTINQVEVNGVLLPNAVGAKVALVNGFGVQADEQILNNASGTIIFNTAGYVPGIYYVRLIDGQGNTLNHKLACIGL